MSSKRSLTGLVEHFHERTSLTLKMVLMTVCVGLFMWAFLDYVQSSKLKKIFYVQLFEQLTNLSMDDRIHFDQNINFYHKSVKLFISQNNLSDYVDKQSWSSGEPVQVKYYDRTPPWLPKPSALRVFANPRYAMLIDPEGVVREVYRSRYDSVPPASLLRPSQHIFSSSNNQSFITKIDDTLYIFASAAYLNNSREHQSTLMLVSPIDDEFLTASSSTYSPGHLVALVTPDKEPRILTSSNIEKLSPGTSLNDLNDRYIITGQQTYDYGAAEYMIRLISLISMSEVDKLTQSVIATGRHQRNIIAPVFILIFALIMLWITKRVNRLNKHMSDFSENKLGMQTQELQQGDQLMLLEKRFDLLTKEVLDARDMLKKQEEEKTRLIVENAFNAIITMDEKGIITTWNHQAEVTFGLTHDQAIGQKVSETIIPPSYRESHENGLENYLATGRGLVINMQVQLTALHNDGHEFPVEMSVSAARSGNSQVFIAVIRDISERKRIEDELTRHRMHLSELVDARTAELTKTNKKLHLEIAERKQAEDKKAQLLKELESVNQELKDFAYIVSHDLKAPLRAISTLANWLSVDYKDKLDDEGKEQLHLLIKRASRMNDLINGILEYSRLGRVKEKKVKVDVNEIVKEVIEFIAPPDHIAITIENELPSIVFEKTRITEIFQNLLSNAIKFMDKPQGTVTIGCVKSNGYWKFNVTDNGPGIEEKYFEKIFQIFQSLSPRDELESTGVGLTLIKKIITMYSGSVWIESKIDRGSTFFFTLPIITDANSSSE